MAKRLKTDFGGMEDFEEESDEDSPSGDDDVFIAEPLRIQSPFDELELLTLIITPAGGSFGQRPQKRKTLTSVIAALLNEGFINTFHPPEAFLAKVRAINANSTGSKNSPDLSRHLAELAIVVRDMLEHPANAKLSDNFTKARNKDLNLVQFIEDSNTAFAQLQSERAVSKLKPSLRDFSRPYTLGLERPTPVNKFKFPDCPFCHHPYVVQVETPASLAATNAAIRAENERRRTQWLESKTGVSGQLIKKEPQGKPEKEPTLQCDCFVRNCFGNAILNKQCLECSQKANKGSPYALVRSPSGVGSICTCPICACVCRAAFSAGDYADIKALSIAERDSPVAVPQMSSVGASPFGAFGLVGRGGAFNSLAPPPPSSSSSSSSSAAGRACTNGEVMMFGSSGARFQDYSQGELDALAESVTQSMNPHQAEAFRRDMRANITPTTVMANGQNARFLFQGNHRIQVGMLGSAGDYSRDYAHHPSRRNPTPKTNPNQPGMLRAPVAAPVAAPAAAPAVALTAAGIALRQVIIDKFAAEYAADDDDDLDLLVGTNAEGPVAPSLANILNALATVKTVGIDVVIAKLRKAAAT